MSRWRGINKHRPSRATLEHLLGALGLLLLVACDCPYKSEPFPLVLSRDSITDVTVSSLEAKYGVPTSERELDVTALSALSEKEHWFLDEPPTSITGRVEIRVWKRYCWFRKSSMMIAVSRPGSSDLLDLKVVRVFH